MKNKLYPRQEVALLYQTAGQEPAMRQWAPDKTKYNFCFFFRRSNMPKCASLWENVYINVTCIGTRFGGNVILSRRELKTGVGGTWAERGRESAGYHAYTKATKA